jgi:hypothetical protein
MMKNCITISKRICHGHKRVYARVFFISPCNHALKTNRLRLAFQRVFFFGVRNMNTIALDATTVREERKQAKQPARLTINLPADLMDDLKGLAETEAVTMTEIVRRALSAERFLREQQQSGNQLLVLEKGEKKPSKVVVFR